MKSDKWQFVTMVEHEVAMTADSFEEAWRLMYNWVNGLIAAKKATWQVIETTIWILPPNSVIPIMFYDARDRACQEGIMDKIKAEEAFQKKQGFE